MANHIITPEPINEYAYSFSTPTNTILTELEQQTHTNVNGAHMLSGPLQGAFLKMMSQFLKPKNILELGTYTGYSAICLAYGLQEGGTLHTIDTDAALQSMRDEYWEKAGMKDKIIMHTGKALEVLPTLNMEFDLVFIDADKRNYGAYLDAVLDIMPIGGCIIADNVLFHGEVILPIEMQSNAGKFMNEFNKYVLNNERVEQVILPVRDGLSIIRKIK